MKPVGEFFLGTLSYLGLLVLTLPVLLFTGFLDLAFGRRTVGAVHLALSTVLALFFRSRGRRQAAAIVFFCALALSSAILFLF